MWRLGSLELRAGRDLESRDRLRSQLGLDVRSLRGVVQLVQHLLPICGCLGVWRGRGLVWVSVLDCFPVVLCLHRLFLLRHLHWLGRCFRSSLMSRVIRLSRSGRNRLGLRVDLCRWGLRDLNVEAVVDLIVVVVLGF